MVDFNDLDRMIKTMFGHDPASNKRMLNVISKVVFYLEKMVNEIKDNKKISRETLIEATFYIDAVRHVDEMKDLAKEFDGLLRYFKKHLIEENYEEIDEKNARKLVENLAMLKAYEAFFGTVLVE